MFRKKTIAEQCVQCEPVGVSVYMTAILDSSVIHWLACMVHAWFCDYSTLYSIQHSKHLTFKGATHTVLSHYPQSILKSTWQTKSVFDGNHLIVSPIHIALVNLFYPNEEIAI